MARGILTVLHERIQTPQPVQMVIEAQLHKKRKEQELARIKAEQKAAKQEEVLLSQDSEETSEDPEP